MQIGEMTVPDFFRVLSEHSDAYEGILGMNFEGNPSYGLLSGVVGGIIVTLTPKVAESTDAESAPRTEIKFFIVADSNLEAKSLFGDYIALGEEVIKALEEFDISYSSASFRMLWLGYTRKGYDHSTALNFGISPEAVIPAFWKNEKEASHRISLVIDRTTRQLKLIASGGMR